MPRMHGACPRCRTTFDTDVEPSTYFLCPGCGARLKSRAAAPPSPRPEQVTERLKAAVAAAAAATAGRHAPDRTIRFDGEPDAPAPAPPAFPPSPPPPPPEVVAPPPEAPQLPSARPEAKREAMASGEPTPGSSLEELMYALYLVQKQILTTLQTRLGSPAPAPEAPKEAEPAVESDEFAAFPPAPTRARRRKTVLLVNDDEATAAAVAALEQAEIPVRTARTTAEALAAIAAEKPDVIALEPELRGDRSGEHLIDGIKSTMEWVDIPIVLYTRADVQSQEQARTHYGGDEFVLKGPQGPTALVSQIITLFRRTH